MIGICVSANNQPEVINIDSQAKMFSTLHRAIERGDEYVVAEDVSSDGKKQFYTGTLEKLRRVYQTKTHHHWYECLQENRTSRLFLDVDAKQPLDIGGVVTKLNTALDAFLKHKGLDVQPVIEVLDSTGTHKYSWHILVTNVIFKNVYHVGAFVRRLLLWYADCPDMQAIDSAVYTRNRMFRLPGSSKFGSPRVLRADKPWWQLLVQMPTVHPVDCLEIDQSVPVSTSAPPHELFREHEDGTWSAFASADGTWARTAPAYAHRSSSTMSCGLISPVLDWLDRHEQGETQRHKLKLLESGKYCVSSKSRKCRIAGRTHKGNHIWYMLDLPNRQIVQRCMDAECGKRKHIIPCPEHIWDRWTAGWMSVEPAPNNQNTLYNISY